MLAKRMVSTLNQSKEEWLRLKKLGISGSEIASIVGINPYSNAVKVYLDKISDEIEDFDNESMYWGRTLEEVVAKEFALRHPNYKVKRVNAILQHPEHDWVLGNIDRLITNEKGEQGVLEIKTASEYLKDKWEADTVPDNYLCQLQWYLFCTGLKFGYFSCLIGGNKYVEKYVERDDELIQMLFSMAERFWKFNVLAKCPPQLDGSSSSDDILKHMYPQSIPESEITLETSAVDYIKKIEECKTEITRIETIQAEAENRLKAMLGDNEKGIVPGDTNYIVTWSSYTMSRIDSKKLKAEAPNIYSKYCDESSVRKFAIKAMKGKK